MLLVVLSALAVRSSSVAVRQSVLLVDLLFVAVAVGFLGLWPVPAAIAVVLAWWLSGRGVDERRWSSWCRRGRWTRDLPWLVAGTVVVAAGALLAWQRLFDGTLPQEYVDAAAGQPWWAIVLAGVGFSLLNAAVEEIVFRGVLLSALTDVLGVRVAVVLQAVAFGVLHLHGVPSGPVGMVMAGAWGLLLGVIDARTQPGPARPVRDAHRRGRHDRAAHAAGPDRVTVRRSTMAPGRPRAGGTHRDHVEGDPGDSHQDARVAAT